MQRKRMVAGNWKMNTGLTDGYKLLQEILERVSDRDLERCDVGIFAPFTHLKVFQNTLNGSGINLGAQNCHHLPSGAYTGEVSAEMLASIPVAQVLVGHSERREYFNENDEQLAQKVDRCLENELVPVFCFGETLKQREDDKYLDVVSSQIANALFHLDAVSLSKVVLAYEPVWAIGTGVTASAGQAQEIHAFVRGLIAQKYSFERASECIILYGGSVKPGNAAELFGMPDIDGGLIGGASLDANSFEAIIKA